MAICARKLIVDPSLTRWYHCVKRRVRRGFLLGEGPLDRKDLSGIGCQLSVVSCKTQCRRRFQQLNADHCPLSKPRCQLSVVRTSTARTCTNLCRLGRWVFGAG